MQYREDKRSGNMLSGLGFGCMRFPGGVLRIDKGKTEALLLKAFESGVNYYDTAYIYPGSEETAGEIFEKHKLREKVYIATKLPVSGCGAPYVCIEPWSSLPAYDWAIDDLETKRDMEKLAPGGKYSNGFSISIK